MYTDCLTDFVFHGFELVHVGALYVRCGVIITALFEMRLVLLFVSVLAENTVMLVDNFECLFSQSLLYVRVYTQNVPTRSKHSRNTMNHHK
jgi:hypothetical protein